MNFCQNGIILTIIMSLINDLLIILFSKSVKNVLMLSTGFSFPVRNICQVID